MSYQLKKKFGITDSLLEKINQKGDEEKIRSLVENINHYRDLFYKETDDPLRRESIYNNLMRTIKSCEGVINESAFVSENDKKAFGQILSELSNSALKDYENKAQADFQKRAKNDVNDRKLDNRMNGIDRSFKKRNNLSEEKFYAWFKGKKIEIQANNLYDARKKAEANFKPSKKDQGLLAVKSAKSMERGDFRYESLEEMDMNKFAMLGRSGLFDMSQLPKLKRALSKGDAKLSMNEKGLLLSLLDKLMSHVTTQGVFTKIKQSLNNEEMIEFAQNYIKEYIETIEENQIDEASSKIKR